MNPWIFGYGSLVWRPAFAFVERVPAVLEGFERRFWQGSPDHRGTPAQPGRVVTVLPAEHSRIAGMAYRVAPEALEAVTTTLGVREQAGYESFHADAELDDGRTVQVALYAAGPGNPSWMGPAPVPEVARHIHDSHGPSGPNLTYLLHLERALAALGHPDPHVTALTNALARPWRPRVARVPRITTEQRVGLEQLLQDGGLSLAQRMESAGSALARVARGRFLGRAQGSRVIVVVGPGGNGGGALVAARYLASWGASVEVVLAKPVRGPGEVQLRALGLAEVPVSTGQVETRGPVDLVIDGLLGARPRGAPSGAVGSLVAWANAQEAPVLALDVPSGVHGDGGAEGPRIGAWATLALGLPTPACTGEIYVADVGVPRALYERLGLPVPVLGADLVRVA